MITPTHPDYGLLKEFYNNFRPVPMRFEDTSQDYKEHLAKTYNFAWFKLRRAWRGLKNDILSTFKKLQHGK